MGNVMKLVKFPEESGLFVNSVNKTKKNEQKGWFLNMF